MVIAKKGQTHWDRNCVFPACMRLASLSRHLQRYQPQPGKQDGLDESNSLNLGDHMPYQDWRHASPLQRSKSALVTARAVRLLTSAAEVDGICILDVVLGFSVLSSLWVGDGLWLPC